METNLSGIDSVKSHRVKKDIQNIIDFALALVAICFLMRFVLLTMDPTLSEIPQQGTVEIYPAFRVLIDALYWFTGLLMTPLDETLNIIGRLTGAFPNEYFPSMRSEILGDWLQARLMTLPAFAKQGIPLYVFESPASTWMPGYFQWSALIAGGLYLAIRQLLSDTFFTVRNFWLNFVVEKMYIQQRQDKFNEVLRKKNEELSSIEMQSEFLKKEVRNLSSTLLIDPLTKAYNRRFFAEKVRELFLKLQNEQGVMTIMMVDIDHFKKVNDTYGHLIGDEVLTKVAEVIQKLTPEDCFCCRYGGEEFIVLMPSHLYPHVLHRGEIIRKEMLKQRFANLTDFQASVSIGVGSVDFSSIHSEGKIPHYDDLIKLADDALYQAKTNGRNQVKGLSVDSVDSVD